MRTLLTISLFFSFFCACTNKMVAKKYSIGTENQITERGAYIDFIKQKKFFPVEQMLYTSRKGYIPFHFNVMQRDSSIVYMGTYINDSLRILKPEFLQDNQSCSGRLQTEIERILQANPAVAFKTENTEPLAIYDLHYLINKEPFLLSKSGNKQHIFLIFSQGYGTYYNQFYKDVEKFYQQYASKANLYVITLEPVYQFK